MTQLTINDLTIKRAPRHMVETVWLDDRCIGNLIYDRHTMDTANITAWPDAGRPEHFCYRNMDQAKQHLINQYLKNREN